MNCNLMADCWRTVNEKRNANEKNTSYFACVVYLSIAVNHVTDVDPFLFVLNRCFDTVIGIAVGLFVNTVHFHGPGRK